MSRTTMALCAQLWSVCGVDNSGLSIRSVAPCDLSLALSHLRLCRPGADEQIRRSLAQYGQLTALAAFDDGKELSLVDGFKRLRASRHLGWTSLQVRVLSLDATMATAVISALHEQDRLSELDEGWLCRALHRDHGLSQGAVGQLLRRHKSWVSRRLLLVEGLDDAVQADVRLGLLSPRSALAVAALPRGNQRRALHALLGSLRSEDEKRKTGARKTETHLHKKFD